MSDKLGPEEQTDPHRIMHALFDCTTHAIQERDIAQVIRCFRLTKQLVELEGECDRLVTNAIWTSYIHRFHQNDAPALKIFRDIDPEVRGTLYSPFTFPHTWLRELTIRPENSDRWETCLTIERQVEAEARRVRQLSCPGRFAVVRVRLEPMLEERCVEFRNLLDESDDAPLSYIEAVIEGATLALAGLGGANKGVCFLRIELLVLRHNAVDSQRSDS